MGMNLLNNQTLLGLCALDPIRNIAILKKNILTIDDLTSAQFAMILVDLTSYVNQLRAQLPELISNMKAPCYLKINFYNQLNGSVKWQNHQQPLIVYL
jgi:hypothetical protein